MPNVNLHNIFFTKIGFRVLKGIYEGATYSTQIAYNNEISFYAVEKHVKRLEKMGLVSTEKKGRIRILRLTKKGRELVEAYLNVLKVLEKVERLTQLNPY